MWDPKQVLRPCSSSLHCPGGTGNLQYIRGYYGREEQGLAPRRGSGSAKPHSLTKDLPGETVTVEMSRQTEPKAVQELL